MLRSIPLGNSYFPTRISESEVGVLAEFPNFPLGNTTSDFNGTIFRTGKLVNTSFGAHWNAALVLAV